MIISNEISKEQAILEVAERLFLEKGFALTSTTEIAKEVGCNQAMVHYYFRTKDKLFDVIFENKIKMFISFFLQIDDENIPFLEKVKRKIETHYEILRSNPGLPFLFFNTLTSHPEKLEVLKSKLFNTPNPVFFQMHEQLQTEIKAGNIRPIETIDLLLSIISLNVIMFIGSPIIKKIGNVSDADFEIMVNNRKNENVTMILNGLRP